MLIHGQNVLCLLLLAFRIFLVLLASSANLDAIPCVSSQKSQDMIMQSMELCLVQSAGEIGDIQRRSMEQLLGQHRMH